MSFVPLEGTRCRRRVYLMRHGAVAYYDATGQPLNPKLAGLTEDGRAQSRAAGAALAAVSLDRVVCSGLPRTRETAELAVAGRGLPVEEAPGFLEIRAGRFRLIPREEREAAYVYGYEAAMAVAARFAGGDVFTEVQARVVAALEVLLAEPGWTRLLLVAHDGVNRMLLSWMCGAGLAALSAFEQDFATLNVLDFDVDEDGQVLRRLIRAANVTPWNIAKAGCHQTSLEEVFRPLLVLD